ncbi:thiol peroxidase [Aeropyrum pernix K1]|uniref:thioredoxin-dependent peroxiredoxin n=1 Tax=Aeropyrum pernix (strain ATCC 700893 / DSM 11879 / JCM 9820 / NBRC 100138 / K1) TaxID=272557 RepID=Q9YG15_AERPE|nr:peroxiredoxin [Aeropyrum pernix]BAA78995.1 thiol peroxidase [Aeropyrum pernix K1]
MPGVGEQAPDFEGIAHTGEKIRLSDFRGRIVVLYFYPRAMTPGCTREGVRFNELLDEFEKLGAVVIGVSTDSVEKNRKFAEKHGFRFKLVSDEKGEIGMKYGVVRGEGSNLAAERVTFIIDREGNIRAILRNIRPAEKHADLALEEVKKLVLGKKAERAGEVI